MLSSIIGNMLAGPILDKLFGTIGGIIERYQQKQITDIEAKKMIVMAFVGATKEIEVTYAQELSKTYATMMNAVQTNPMVARVWMIVTMSQLFVLFWYQFIVPFIAFIAKYYFEIYDFKYPSAGSTIDWAYAMLGGLVGLGALSLKNTAGSGAMYDRLKSLMVR